MKAYAACIWIVLAALMLLYLIWRNRKLTKVLREVLELTEQSERKCEQLLERMQDTSDKKERQTILRELRAEERRMQSIFAKEEEWPGQGKRIREHMSKLKAYHRAALEQNVRMERENNSEIKA